MIEQICCNCANAKVEGATSFECGIGRFMECQCAGTTSYFEQNQGGKMKNIVRTFLVFVIMIAICLSFDVTAQASDTTWTVQQQKANQIAEIARSMGLLEDDPIIVRAKELWHEDEGYESDIRIIATVIYNEAGNGCTERHQLLVGRVVLNRVANPLFPSTVYDVVAAPRQYRVEYANGSSKYAVPSERLEEFESLARRALNGEPYDCPSNILYQDNQRHGTGLYESYYSTLLKSTTYFCYG